MKKTTCLIGMMVNENDGQLAQWVKDEMVNEPIRYSEKLRAFND